MKKILSISALVILAGLLIVFPVLASDISDATFIGTITVTNVGTATTHVFVPFTLSTADLIANDYINATCTDTAVRINGADVAYMPAPGATTDWCLYVPSVPVGNSTASLYTGGNTDMAAKLRYFPDTNGMAVTDNATLEPGNNFEIVMAGRIDTTAGADKYLVYKQDALQTYVDASTSGKINAIIPDAVVGLIEHTTYSNDGSIAGADWQAQTFTTGSSAFKVTTIDLYLKNSDPAAQAVTVDIKAVDGTGKPTGGVLSTGSCNEPGSLSWVNCNVTDYNLSPNTQYAIIVSCPAGILYWGYNNANTYAGGSRLTSADSGATWTIQSTQDNDFKVNGLTPVSASITGVASGEYTLTTSADTSYLILSLNGDTSWDGIHSARTALAGASVANNANNWTFLKTFCMPYMEYITFDVGGAPVSAWEWENNTTFHDSVGANDATPTFRTTSSDGDVSAALTNFEPVSLSEASGSYITGEGDTFISGVPGAIPNMYDEGETGGLFGLEDFVNPVLAAIDIPEAVFWYPIAFAVAIGLGFSAFHFTRQLLVQAVVSGVIMAFFSIGGVLGDGLLPFWTVLIFIIEAVMLLIIQEKQTV